ncbi:MAG: (Fe-S)-binding protein [Candidatus Hydrothermarchaeales archaeon]
MNKAEISNLVRQCYQCGICSGVCPKARVKPGFLPRKMVYEMISGSQDRAIDSGDAWTCLTCGLCELKCPMNVNFLDMVRETRAQMMGKNVICTIAHDNDFGSFYNIMKNEQIKPKRKEHLAEDVKTDDKSKVLYFMGCLPYFDIIFKDDVGFEGMDIANNTIRLLNQVGITPAVLDEEKCCGHDQLWRGQTELFEELAKNNIKYLKNYETIVTNCPECLRTLKKDYKEKLGLELDVKHISEFLAEKGEELTPNEDDKKKITYHDSCRLGRHMGIYEAPRELLEKMNYNLEEMIKNKEEALCCGVSAFVNCDDENTLIRRQKMKQALDTGAETLVTPCPKCQIHLKCLQMAKSEPDYNIRIADLTTVLFENLKR